MLTLEEERVCAESAWEATVVARCARAPKGTKAASSDASGWLRLLIGMDPSSLRAASVTLMHRRGQPLRLCLLRRKQCLDWLPCTSTSLVKAGMQPSACLKPLPWRWWALRTGASP